MLNSTEISELLCTKLCHDLAGPIGAINNGIDFLESDNKQMQEKAYELVRLSSKQAVNRLTFFRQAYGVLSRDAEAHLAELRSLILKFIEDTKLSLDFADQLVDNSDIIRARSGKLLLNTVIIAAHVVMYNGLIIVNVDSLGDRLKIKISAEAASYKLEEELVSILNYRFDNIDVNSRNIQHYYTAVLLQELGGSINILEQAGKVTFTLTCEK